MSLFCQDCGNEIASQYKFCPACGGRNLALAKPTLQASPPAYQQPINQPPTSASNWQNQVAVGVASTGMVFGQRSYAGFWRRLFAYLLDLLLTSVVFFILGMVIGYVAPNINTSSTEVAFNLLAILITWIYFANSESGIHQATFGKRALGLKVCDVSGNRLTFGRASGRFFGKIISGLIFGIGFLMVAFTKQKQGLHDQMAKALVIRTGE